MRLLHDERAGVTLDQEQAIMEAATKFWLADARPVKTPMSGESTSSEGEDKYLAADASAEDGAGATIKNFQSLVGSLLWITRMTRPDIAYAVH